VPTAAQLDRPRKVASRVSEAVYDTIPISDHRGSQAFSDHLLQREAEPLAAVDPK
jgi:hypothetical protein